MPKTAAIADVIDQSAPLSNNADAHESALRASNPDLADEIYGTTPERNQGTVTSGQPTRAEPVVVEPVVVDPVPPIAVAEPEPPIEPGSPEPHGRTAPIMVPKDRLDEALRKLDAATQRLNEVASTAAPASVATPEPAAAPVFDLEGKLREKLRAQWDGNEDEVIRLDLEIEAHRQQQATAAAVSAVRSERTADTVQAQILAAAEQVVVEYPGLNVGNEGHNKDAIAAFKVERDAQLAAGKTPEQAMRRAALLVAEDFGLQKATPAATPPPVVVPSQVTPSGAAAITARQVDVARTAAAIAATPPNNVGGRSQGDIAPASKEVSRDEWKNMSTAQKNEALGIA